MLLPLDLRLLWYFKRTAEIGSLTRAAAELGTSQPALTRHIMRLEHELRATLLLRDQRGVTPTEAGALVLDKAENLLRLEQAMKDDIGALSRRIEGEVSLYMPSSMHWIVTSPMTGVVRAKFPDIRLRLMDGFDHLSRAQLKSRSADIGVIVYDRDSILEGIDCRPIATEQLCLIGGTPPAIPPGPVHLAKIAGLPLILPNGQDILRRRLELAFRRAPVSGHHRSRQLSIDDRSDPPEPRVHDRAVLFRCAQTRGRILVVTHQQFVAHLGHCDPGSTRLLASRRSGCRSVAAAHQQLDRRQRTGPCFPSLGMQVTALQVVEEAGDQSHCKTDADLSRHPNASGKTIMPTIVPTTD
jgi:DNA-binding transcriptional LysR family regulator